MPTLSYDLPTNADLQEVESEVLPVLTMEDPLFEICPLNEVDADVIEWEQQDWVRGLMSVRGLNGNPGRVNRLGSSKYSVEPMYAGEYTDLEEKEVTKRRKLGTYAEPANFDDLIAEKFKQLLKREIDLKRKVIADFLCTGTYSVLGDRGQVMKTDSFNITSQTAAVLWSDYDNATPIRNIRAIIAGILGFDYTFGPEAWMLMNTNTCNLMLNNTNSKDLFGKRMSNGSTYNSLSSINEYLKSDNLPQVMIYDKAWFAEGSTTPTFFIPNGKVVIVGKRPTGRMLGEFVTTRNANTPDPSPKAYNWIVDPFQFAQGNVLPAGGIPRTIQVHRGFNGGLRWPYPRGVLALTVL